MASDTPDIRKALDDLIESDRCAWDRIVRAFDEIDDARRRACDAATTQAMTEALWEGLKRIRRVLDGEFDQQEVASE